MTDKTERDALVATLQEMKGWRMPPGKGAEYNNALDRAIEALAAPAEGASAEDYERELSAVMPEDFKDWHQNDKREWPAVAAAVIRNLREREAMAWEQAAPAEGDGAVAAAWAEGYASGVTDERTSEANIGIAGFGAKVEPARENPYTRPAAAAPVPEGFVLVPRAAALVAAAVADEWAAMFADIPGLEKYDRFQYGPAVEQMRDDMLAAAPAAPKGGVNEAMVERALAAYLRVQDAGESLYGCVTSALTAALNPEPQS